MLHKLLKRARSEKGFTLIELLVVILIIGILAAIAIPSFLGQRTKATDTEAKTGAKTAATAMETWFTDNQTYVGATRAELLKIEPTLSDVPAARFADPTVGVDSYTIVVASDRDAGAVAFSLVRASTGATTRTCAVTGSVSRGGCKADGKW